MPVYLSRNVPPTAYESIAICHCFRHEAQICLVAATASWRLSFWSQRTLRSVAGAVFRPVGSSLSGGRLLPAIRTQSPRASRSRPANRTRYARSGRDRENQGRALWVRPPVAYISWQNVLPERRGGMTRKPVVVPALMTHAPSPNRDEIAGRIAIGLGTLADLSLVHRFVFLCFTNRSGSAYLGDILSSTGYFLPAGESFNAVEVLAACQERGLRSFNEYFSYIVRRDTRSNTYIVKVAPEQILLLIHSGILDQIIDRSAFLFLRRADELAQAVSQAIAEQNNHWTWDLPKSVPDDKLVYSSKRISELLYFISYSNQCFEQFFSYNGIVPINVEYERVISQPQQELYEIVRRLVCRAWEPISAGYDISANRMKSIRHGERASCRKPRRPRGLRSASRGHKQQKLQQYPSQLRQRPVASCKRRLLPISAMSVMLPAIAACGLASQTVACGSRDSASRLAKAWRPRISNTTLASSSSRCALGLVAAATAAHVA
jgi:LPS sulfotransferase NodH